MQLNIHNLDTEQSFWQTYPEFKVVEPFKSLFLGDKSKGQKNSSQLCWFIAICYAPLSSFAKKPKDGKDGVHAIVAEDFLEDKEYYSKNQVILSALIPAFLELVMTPMERQLRMFERKLEEREAFIRDTPYDVENWKKMDDALGATEKMWAQYKTLQEKLSQESEEGTTWGDQEESATEKGLI